MIAPIIHQIWHPFSCTEMPLAWQRFARTWRRWHPEHRYILWGANESREFVAERYPELLPVYDGYVSPMKRVAALRYMLLHHQGGVVVDLDVECLRSFEEILAGQSVVLASEPTAQWPPARLEKGEPVLSTAFLASEARHPFWSAVLEQLKASAQTPGVPESVGNAFLTRCYETAPDRTGFRLLPPEVVNPVDVHACMDGSAFDLEQWMKTTKNAHAVHHWAGTWHRPGPDPLRACRPYKDGLPARIHHPAWNKVRNGQLFDSGPLVSCIMVTRGWAEPARWAIEAFRNQTYRRRELVVVTTNPDGDLRAYVESLRDPLIRLLPPLPPKTSLGAQRNAAVEAARGEFICTWDDDDLYGVDRLAASITAIATSGAAAAFLERIGIWWPARQQYAITSRRPWENTMVAQRGVLARYPEIDRGEDTKVIDALIEKFPVVTVNDPNLYTYVVWGTNTWGSDHFQKLMRGATYQIDKLGYDRALTVLDKHVPVLEYLAWLQHRDPKTYDPDPDSPAPLSAIPARAGTRAEPAAPRLVPGVSAVPAADPGRPLRFLLAWELGAGFGHMVPLAQIARPLLDAGHEVHLALLDLTTSRVGLGNLVAHPRLHLWQSPHWAAPLHGTSDPVCFAELLYRAGYLDARRLAGLIDAWSSLFRQVKPDMVLAEHAPTALLAARGHRFARAMVGSGFFVPPRESPIPTFREWQSIPGSRVENAEARVLATCNEILAARNLPPLSALWELFDVDEQFLTTVSELDYYPQRARDPEQRYMGPLAPASHGTAASWPRGTEPALFAYIRGEYAAAEAALSALRSGPWRVLAFSPGLPPQKVLELSSSKMNVVSDPVDMNEVCNSADAVVCNSGSGTVTTALHAGKPLVMLPIHVEQFLVARRVQSIGAGLLLLDDRIDRLGESVERVITQPSYREAALAFSRRYAAPQGNRVAETIAARCAELAMSRGKQGQGGAGRGQKSKHKHR